jgi:glycosyltransferase involved in cell wall biosynthesis
MKALVVYPASGWILTRIGQRIAEAGGYYHTAIGEKTSITEDLDFVFYCDIQNCWNPQFKETIPNAKHIGLFTHLDKDDVKSFLPAWKELDGVVHMCERYYEVFYNMCWYERQHMTVIPPGYIDPEEFELKRVCIGVCQRGGFEGKGDPFLYEVFNKLPSQIRETLALSILGSGWDIDKFIFPHDQIYIQDNENYENYPIFYDCIDYLLIPSKWEAGPMAVLEAMATGTPIIASDVGWIGDFGYIEHIYKPGDRHDLTKILTELVDKRVANRKVAVHDFSYPKYVQRLERFVKGLEDGSV